MKTFEQQNEFCLQSGWLPFVLLSIFWTFSHHQSWFFLFYSLKCFSSLYQHFVSWPVWSFPAPSSSLSSSGHSPAPLIPALLLEMLFFPFSFSDFRTSCFLIGCPLDPSRGLPCPLPFGPCSRFCLSKNMATHGCMIIGAQFSLWLCV